MKQIAFTILLVTLAAVHAKYDIRYALPEQMLQFLKQRTSAFSELNFTNSTNSVKLRLVGVEKALYYKNGSARVQSINEHVEKVGFGIHFGSIDLRGEVIATVNGKQYRGLLQSIQLDNASIYFDVYYNNRTRGSIVQVYLVKAREYIHFLSWYDCERYNSAKECKWVANEVSQSVEKNLPDVLQSNIRIAVLNNGAPFQYKESPDVTDMPTTSTRYWDSTTEYSTNRSTTRWWRGTETANYWNTRNYTNFRNTTRHW